MDDITSIEKVLKENPEDPESQPLNGETGDGAKSADQILKQIKFIGDKVTEVSTKNKNNSKSNGVVGSIK